MKFIRLLLLKLYANYMNSLYVKKLLFYYLQIMRVRSYIIVPAFSDQLMQTCVINLIVESKFVNLPHVVLYRLSFNI